MAKATPDPRGESHLGRRQFRLAAESFRKNLEQHPGDPELRLGLARAWAGLEWCERAIPVFQELRSTEFYGTREAMDHGACLSAVGRTSEGIEALEEAVLLSGGGTGAVVQLAWEALKGGDEPLFQAVAAALIEEQPGSPGALLLEGASCWLAGDDACQESALQTLRQIQGHSPQADLLDCWSALERGEPTQAAEILRGDARLNRMRLPEVASWLAEANRRAGQAKVAHTILTQQARGQESSVLRHAINLRIRIDLEGVPAVRADIDSLLARHPTHPEALATAWYAATLAGLPDVDSLASLYALHGSPDRAPLDLLRPPAHSPSEAP